MTATQARIVLALVAFTACTHRIERSVQTTPEELRAATVDHRPPFLKAHMRDGDLYVLDRWDIHETDQYLDGDGVQLGTDRVLVEKGHFRIAFADVALYETNTIIRESSVAAVAVVTGMSVALSVACLTNPKACFGSCPTFYAQDTDGRWVLQAEGFSDAIAPELETNDIDALWRTPSAGGQVVVKMTNEAYETHVVKGVELLAVPRPSGGRVLATPDALWSAGSVAPALECDDAAGACTDRVRALDGNERTSLTDEHDLGARETIELTMPPGTGRQGIVIGARQSLVTTFLIYQGLAYLGDTAAMWLGSLDKIARAGGRGFEGALGGIEVLVMKDGVWKVAGDVYETGPLATDVHLVMLPDGVDARHVRLRLAQGGWRIDYVALASMLSPATPLRFAPTSIRGTLGPEYGQGRTAATSFPIVTQPGDGYELTFSVPHGDYELFIDSRGYYLEWMRQEWLREQNPLAAIRMLLDPARALRDLAPAFKRIEPQAEQLFWRSRYAHP